MIASSFFPDRPSPTDSLGRQLDIAIGKRGCDERLVGGLVAAESDVPVGTEDPALAPLRLELGQQRFHGSANLGLVGVLVPLPVRLGIVGLEPLEELQGFYRPTP